MNTSRARSSPRGGDGRFLPVDERFLVTVVEIVPRSWVSVGDDERGRCRDVWEGEMLPVWNRSGEPCESISEIADALGVLSPESDGVEDCQAVSGVSQIAEARMSTAHPPPRLGRRRGRTRTTLDHQTRDSLATHHHGAGDQQPRCWTMLSSQPGERTSLLLQSARDALKLDDHRLGSVGHYAENIMPGALSRPVLKLNRGPILDHERRVHARDHPSRLTTTQCHGMVDRSIEPGTEEGWRVIDAAVHRARARLRDGLLSAYAIGSLAHGGFRAAVSDVDLALLTDDRLDRDMPRIVATIVAEVKEGGHELGARLSIFHAPWATFSDPPPDARFPPIDRYDLVCYGILVHGTDLRPRHATVPTADEVRAHAVESALRRVTPAQLAADLRQLVDSGVTVHDTTKIVLWPLRLQHVCDTGQASGNAAAVDYYLKLPDARHRSLARDALGWRDLSAMQNPNAAVERITDEICDLHAEVFQRLGDQPDTPRCDELAQRGRQLTA
jgi:hypothetical protein